MSDKKYPISGSVWFRESTQEWVLELEGSINGTYFIDRHTEPSTTLPEDVPGLPSLYHADDRIEALTKERDEAKALQSCGCSYDTPTDVCLGHHRLFERLYAVQRGKLEAKLATCERHRDAYAECDRIGTQAVRDLEAKLARAEWLLTDAAVQLEEGKIKTRRNRAGLIWQFLEEIRGA